MGLCPRVKILRGVDGPGVYKCLDDQSTTIYKIPMFLRHFDIVGAVMFSGVGLCYLDIIYVSPFRGLWPFPGVWNVSWSWPLEAVRCGVKSTDSRVRRLGSLVKALTLDKSVPLSEPQFPRL